MQQPANEASIDQECKQNCCDADAEEDCLISLCGPPVLIDTCSCNEIPVESVLVPPGCDFCKEMLIVMIEYGGIV